MKTIKINHLKDFQRYFKTDLNLLYITKQNKLNYIEQNHFGDFLIEVVTIDENHKLKLWKNNIENIKLNEPKISIEIFCDANNFTWKNLYNQF